MQPTADYHQTDVRTAGSKLKLRRPTGELHPITKSNNANLSLPVAYMKPTANNSEENLISGSLYNQILVNEKPCSD